LLDAVLGFAAVSSCGGEPSKVIELLTVVVHARQRNPRDRYCAWDRDGTV